MKITIGKHESRNVSLDLDTMLVTRLLITANSGAGKSWLLRVLGEQLFGHVQTIIIDPEGEFASLREKYGYALVGQGGEIPADPRIAGQVAEKLLELNLSAVCDLYEMKAKDRHEWVRNFLEALINAPKKLWHPAVVIVDEAQMFCPESKAGESVATEAMIELGTKGRKRGYCGVFATQKLSNLQKTLTTNLLNRIVGGTFEDVDVKRALDLLSVAPEDKRQFSHDLRVLEPGWFYGLGRAIAKERVLFQSAGVETSHPKPGSSKHAAAPPPPPEKVKAVLAQLAEIPHEAEEKARTVADFKKQIAQMKHDLTMAKRAQPAAPKTAAPDQAKLRAQFERDIAREIARRDQLWTRLINDYIRAYRNKFALIVASTLRDCQAEMLKAEFPEFVPPAKVEGAVLSAHTPNVDERPAPRPQHVTAAGAGSSYLDRQKPRGPEAAGPAGTLGKGESATLIAIAQLADGATRAQLTQLTGYKRSTRDAYIKRLGAAGYVSVNGDSRIRATSEGIAALGDKYEPLPTGEALQEKLARELSEGERKILEAVCCAYPEGVDRDGLSDATGYKRSTRDAYIQRLVARELVTIERGEVKAVEMLFG